MFSLKVLFLILSTLFSIGCIIPYVSDILKGETKPNIVTWLTWTLLTIIATFAELASGETKSAVFTGAVALEAGIVVILGLKYGYAKYTRFDYYCQFGAIAGLLLWWLFNSPLIAIVAAIAIDLIGALPTLRHAYIKPNEETTSTFVLASIGGLFALFALDTISVSSAAYAFYIFLMDGLVATILIYKKTIFKN